MSKGGRQRIQIEGINLEIHSIYKLSMFYIYFKYAFQSYSLNLNLSLWLNSKRHFSICIASNTIPTMSLLNLEIVPGRQISGFDGEMLNWVIEESNNRQHCTNYRSAFQTF